MKKTAGCINAFLTGLLSFMLINALLSVIALKNDDKTVLNFFGYIPIKVISDSMSPCINSGDLLISKLVKNADNIGAGDVITFKVGKGIFVTHRVVGKNTENGTVLFETKGDANIEKDPESVEEAQIFAKAVFCVRCAGYISDFAAEPAGFFIFVLMAGLLLNPIKSKRNV